MREFMLRRRVTRSILTSTLVGLATLGTVLGALVFAQSDQAHRVATDAITHARLQEAGASFAAIRADVVIALAAETVAVKEQALDDARARIAAATTMDARSLDADEIAALATSFTEFEQHLLTGDRQAADGPGTELLERSADISHRLIDEASDVEAAILAEASAAGDTARAASVVVALIAPGLTVYLLHRSSRRREEHLALTATLERERAISKVQTHLISGLSHELRTPLTGIAGFAEALLDSEGTDAEFAHEAGRIIYTESNELRRMIEDMLVASRASVGDLAFAPGDVDAALEFDAVVEPFQRSRHEIELDVQPATIKTDRLRLRHILRNLVSNAIAHGGSPVRLVGFVRDDRYVVQVVDHGAGIDPGELDRIRRGFVHGGESATVEGSIGLGFAVASTLAEKLGTHIEVRRVAEATVISIDLPLAASEQANPPFTDELQGKPSPEQPPAPGSAASEVSTSG